MRKLAFLFIALFCAATSVSAQHKQRVAVLPSVGDLDPQRLILLTDRVREIATRHLPMDNFNILKLDVITKMIGEEELYRSCKEGVCIGDLARKTNANYGARCDVVKLDNSLVLKFELYSVDEDAIFETFTDYGVKDFHGMLAVLEARLPATFQKIVYKMVYDKALADAKDKAAEQQRRETPPAPVPVPAPEPPPAAIQPVPPAAVVIQQPVPQIQEVPLRTVDFTAGERWGTWFWNLFPGLGSYAIMDDQKGALINLALFVSGGILALLGVSGNDANVPIVASGFVIGFGASSAWNIYRSAAYHHPAGKPKKPNIPVSYGAGGLFANNVGGGVDFHDGYDYYYVRGGEIAMPYSAGGGYLYFDLAYLELAAGFAGGGGQWKSFDTKYPEYLPDMSRTYMTFSALMKLPFGGERVRFFPLLGIDYEKSISAELKNGLGGITPPEGNELTAFWFKVGAGLDISVRQNMYLRTEALYGLRPLPNAYENKIDHSYGSTSTRFSDGLTLKMGVGLNIVKRLPDAENENKHKNTETAASGQKEEK